MFAVSTDEFADTVCDYIIFCVMCSILQKTVKVYFNNKPWILKSEVLLPLEWSTGEAWISKHIKGMLNQKNNRSLLNIIWKD